MTRAELDQIECQMDGTEPYYVRHLIVALRDEMSSDIRTPQSPSGEAGWQQGYAQALTDAGIVLHLAPGAKIQHCDNAESRALCPLCEVPPVPACPHCEGEGGDDEAGTAACRICGALPSPPDGAQSNRGSDDQKHPDNSTVETTQEPKP